jgi:hypothetical protein
LRMPSLHACIATPRKATDDSRKRRLPVTVVPGLLNIGEPKTGK